MRTFYKDFLLPQSRRCIAGFPSFCLMLVVAAFWPHAAMATTLGDMLCSVSNNLVPSGGNNLGVLKLITGLAYIAGACFIGSGLYLLVKHHENTRDNPFAHVAMRLLGGMALLAFPATIQWLFNTFALQSQGGGIYTANACGNIAAPTTNGDLADMMKNLVYNIADPITLFISILSVVIGSVLVFKGLVKASKYGTDPKANSVPNIIANLFFGAVLITIGTSLDIVFATIFGNGSLMSSGSFWESFGNGAFAKNFANKDDLTSFENTVTAALRFFQIIGLIAFVRGWLILKTSVEGGGGGDNKVAQGLTHVLGGAMAINIFKMLDVLDYTFGSGLLG